jgi:hypothetical protein
VSERLKWNEGERGEDRVRGSNYSSLTRECGHASSLVSASTPGVCLCKDVCFDFMEPRKKRSALALVEIEEPNSSPPQNPSPPLSLPHDEKKIVLIIGGGISGVCCAEELLRLTSRADDSDPNPCHNKIRIILISASETLKEVKSIMKITNSLEEIAVFERKSDYFKMTYPELEIIEDLVVSLDPKTQAVSLQSGQYYSQEC